MRPTPVLLAALTALALAACAMPPGFPGASPVASPAAKAAPSGHVIVRASSKNGPVLGATVAVGGKEAPTMGAVPDAPDPDELDDGTLKPVMHVFDEALQEAELVWRVPLKRPVGGERYAYVRTGEALLEDVPAGPQAVTVRKGEVRATAEVTVVADKVVALDGPVALDLPAEVVVDDGPAPRVIEVRAVTPSTGFVVEVKGATALAYDPADPVLTVAVEAPPGSAGGTVAKALITYGPGRGPRSAARTVAIDPPVVVPPGDDANLGRNTLVRVPLRDAVLDEAVLTLPLDQPDVVVARIVLQDERGVSLLSPSMDLLEAVGYFHVRR